MTFVLVVAVLGLRLKFPTFRAPSQEIISDDNAQSSALLHVEKHVRESIGDAEVLQRRIQLQLEPGLHSKQVQLGYKTPLAT